MKTTLGAIAVTFALIAGLSAANASPAYDTTGDSKFDQVFEPRN